MAHEAQIPPGVAAADAARLRRAYALASSAEGEALYAEWAPTYDQTMVDGLGYVSHQRLVEVFVAQVAWRDRAVLDVGCGTGLVGDALATAGFSIVDGLDYSVAMLAQAAGRSVYRTLVEADLNRPLALPDAGYGAVICNGTFTSGHVDAACLDELVRVIEPGGILACAVHLSVWDSGGFGAAFDRLQAVGTLAPLAVVDSPYYLSSTGPDGRLCAFGVR